MDDQTDTSKFGAAAPIVDPLAKAYDKVRSFFKNVPGKGAPSQPANTDTSWHDSAVDAASKSHADAMKADADKAKAPVTRKALRKAPTKR